MSWRATSAVKALRRTDGISRGEKLVLMNLADYHNDESLQCDPSVRRLAEDSLMGETQCRKLLHTLQEKGFITIEYREGASSNYFLVCVDGNTPSESGGVRKRGRPRRTPAVSEGVGAAKSGDPPLQKRLRKVEPPPSLLATAHIEPQENRNLEPQAEPQEAVSAVISLYQDSIGPVYELIRRELTALPELYAWDWIEAAFEEARKSGGNSLKYVVAILQRWEAQGGKDLTRVEKAAPESAAAQMMRRYREAQGVSA